jgi:transposase InsO family protein
LVYPVQNGINTIQTDNGLEFLGGFDIYIRRKNIRHLFIYPRCPKINAYVERANRTLQEEFIDGHEEYVLEGIEEFNSRLIDYLVWHNTKRVHNSLGNISPINYLLKILPSESQMYVTHTVVCIYTEIYYTFRRGKQETTN